MNGDDALLLRFVRLSKNAHVPVKGSPLSAGFDLFAAYDTVIPANGKAMVKTDLKVAVPHGYYGRIAPRSGLTHKHFIDVGAGVVDEDYRGPVNVILFNFNNVDFEVKQGTRIAQLICEKICYPRLVECETLEETARGEDGFGSTGGF